MASRRNVGKSTASASRSKIFGSSKRSVGASSSRVGDAVAGVPGNITVNGRDVTPRSLLHTKIRFGSTVKKKKPKITSDRTLLSQSSSKKISLASIELSSAAEYSEGGTLIATKDQHLGNNNAPESTPIIKKLLEVKKLVVAHKQKGDDPTYGLTTTVTEATTTNTGPEMESIRFTETPTIMHFTLQSTCIAADSPEHALVMERNKVYKELCESKGSSDYYCIQSVQTINATEKHKEVMVAPPATRDVECEATSWDIYDSQEVGSSTVVEDDDGSGQSKTLDGQSVTEADRTMLSDHVSRVVGATLSAPGCLVDVDSDIVLALKNKVSAASLNMPSAAELIRQKRGNMSGSRNISGSRSNVSGSRAGISGSRKNTTMGASSSRSRLVSTVQSKNSVGQGGIASSRSQIMGSNVDAGMTSSTISQTDDEENRVQHEAVDVNESMAQREALVVFTSDRLLKHLWTVERAIQQNNFHSRHVMYRNAPPFEKPEKEETRVEEEVDDALAELWSFSCDLTIGLTATCITFNSDNHDLLAVSYGAFEFGNQPHSGGVVLFWSLKNPEYPERYYTIPESGATSLDFSTLNPNYLAVGFYNGVVAIYDTNKDDMTPIVQSGQSSGTHMDAVWQVKWVVNKGSDRGESVVSISSDGRVTEWNMKKGLNYSDLMTLKRVHRSAVSGNEGKPKTEEGGVISRIAGGLCLDFSSFDSSVYFAGTEDGIIHKCSCSYNEQYLQSYGGHGGPVYSLRMSPFVPDLFLSCSADWTVKLWHADEVEALLTFHSMDLSNAVHDVAWSQTHATVFASVAEDGRIEIWDLSTSALDPIVTQFLSDGVQASSLTFAPSAPVLAVGDNMGGVHVYRIPVLTNTPPKNQCEQLSQASRQQDNLQVP